MFQGLTFFGIPLTWFLRIAEVFIMVATAVAIYIVIQWIRLKRNWTRGDRTGEG